MVTAPAKRAVSSSKTLVHLQNCEREKTHLIFLIAVITIFVVSVTQLGNNVVLPHCTIFPNSRMGNFRTEPAIPES